MENEIIKRAEKSIQPITYEPNHIGYFVTMNGRDLGGSDYCEGCIRSAVKASHKWHYERREDIIKRHDKAFKKGKYDPKDISKSKRYQLKEFPARASFAYEGHDPDFGGGCYEPNVCDNCGEAFFTEFTANLEEAEHLLNIVNSGELNERDKWEIDMAFHHFQYSSVETQKVLLVVAEKLLSLVN